MDTEGYEVQKYAHECVWKGVNRAKHAVNAV
jgi:hypothetical protein